MITLTVNQVVFGLGRGVLGASANRMGVWTQGCSLNKCPGCSSTHAWSPDGGKAVGIKSLLQLARVQARRPSGLTVSGGEPTDQAPGVRALIEGFRELFPEAEVVLYTGLRWPALAERFPALVAVLDVIVAGPYVRTLDATPLSGSRNQEVRLLTPLAERLYRDWQAWPMHAMQIGHGTENQVVTVGIPHIGRMEQATKRLNVSAVTWQRQIQVTLEKQP